MYNATREQSTNDIINYTDSAHDMSVRLDLSVSLSYIK